MRLTKAIPCLAGFSLVGSGLPAQVRYEPFPVASSAIHVVAKLGRFDVPESYSHKTGKQITLAFLTFGGTGSRHDTPIFYLAGGPGGSGIDDASGPRFGIYVASLQKLGDVIALDQRGTGLSQPNLRCPNNFSYPLDQEATLDRFTREYRKVAQSCAAYWRSHGVSLADYNTEASADDVAALARAIGAPRIRIFAASYGTHLALAIMRRHPTLVESAVLGGLEGPDQTIKLPRNVDAHLAQVAALIASDSLTRQLLPDFRATLRTLTSQLNDRPIDVSIRPRGNGTESRRVRLSGFDVQLLGASLLGRRPTIELIPQVFAPALRGDFTTLATYVADELRDNEISAMGAVMDCASSVSADRWKEIESEKRATVLGTLMDFPMPEWCSAWGVPALPDSFREPVQTSAPVLFIEGSLDGQTPLSNVSELRRGFRNSVLFTVMGAGHDPSMFRSSPELLAAIYAFISGVRAKDTVFIAPPLHFQLPEK